MIILCGLWGMAAFLTFLPLHATALGLSGAGPALAVFGAVVIAVRLFGAKLPDRVGAVPLTATALGFTAVGLGDHRARRRPAGAARSAAPCSASASR